MFADESSAHRTENIGHWSDNYFYKSSADPKQSLHWDRQLLWLDAKRFYSSRKLSSHRSMFTHQCHLILSICIVILRESISSTKIDRQEQHRLPKLYLATTIVPMGCTWYRCYRKVSDPTSSDNLAIPEQRVDASESVKSSAYMLQPNIGRDNLILLILMESKKRRYTEGTSRSRRQHTTSINCETLKLIPTSSVLVALCTGRT